eukprot:14474405-Heterocapsa_arctica.AAC.1
MGPGVGARGAERASAGHADLRKVSALRSTEGRCAAGDRVPSGAETPAPGRGAVAVTFRERPAAFVSIVRADTLADDS